MKTKWTYEICKVEAMKYKTRSEFCKGSHGAYKVAYGNGWIDEFFGQLQHKWTYDTCRAEASKYASRREFHKESRNAYKVAYGNGWLDEFFLS